jgi:hypothetical protein
VELGGIAADVDWLCRAATQISMGFELFGLSGDFGAEGKAKPLAIGMLVV